MRLKYIPDDVQLLIELRNKVIKIKVNIFTLFQGYAVGMPNWNNDDSYVISYSREKKAYILTNDRYNDHINYLSFDSKEKERLKTWIR